MVQLAFDFYDSNNDDKLSEYDMFKVLHYYGAPGWNPYNQPIEKKPIRGGQEREVEFDLFADVI